jgi:hypothetical protein
MAKVWFELQTYAAFNDCNLNDAANLLINTYEYKL